jgi:integrase
MGASESPSEPLDALKIATIGNADFSCLIGVIVPVKVTIRKYKSKDKPHLNWVVCVNNPNGRRQRLFFPTKEKAELEANAKRTEFERIGLRAMGLSDKTRLEAIEAEESLKPYNATISDAVAYYLKQKQAVRTPIRAIADAFIQSRINLGRSERHLATLGSFLDRFCQQFDGMAAADITATTVEQWLLGLKIGPVTVNHYRTLLHSVFAYGKTRKLCPENPIEQIERRTVKKDKVGILTVEQVQLLLLIAEGDVRATIAIGAFAGLRPEEISRITWENVDLEESFIDVGAEKSKTAQQRYVKIQPNLAEWLKPLVGQGPIQQDNFRRRFDETRYQAGFAVRGNKRELSDEEKNMLEPWPHDALRHSFASYHLAKFEKADELALQLGHESTSLIFSNYRHRVKQKEAIRYFDILPLSVLMAKTLSPDTSPQTSGTTTAASNQKE